MSELVLRESRGAVRALTLNRPERLNALSRALVGAIGDAFREVAADRDVLAVVLAGAGVKAFCAGADLKERESMTLDDVRAFLALYRDAFGAVDACPKPVVAAIDGVALGGGFELALACDLRVAGEGAQMGATEVRLGIIPGAGGTQRLPRLVGPGRAKDLILTGRRVGVDEASALGLITRVARGRTAFDVAIDLATEMAANAPIALAQALRAIDGGLDATFEDGLDLERACYETTLATRDRDEGLAAFREKRPPTFKGE